MSGRYVVTLFYISDTGLPSFEVTRLTFKTSVNAYYAGLETKGSKNALEQLFTGFMITNNLNQDVDIYYY